VARVSGNCTSQLIIPGSGRGRSAWLGASTTDLSQDKHLLSAVSSAVPSSLRSRTRSTPPLRRRPTLGNSKSPWPETCPGPEKCRERSTPCPFPARCLATCGLSLRPGPKAERSRHPIAETGAARGGGARRAGPGGRAAGGGGHAPPGPPPGRPPQPARSRRGFAPPARRAASPGRVRAECGPNPGPNPGQIRGRIRGRIRAESGAESGPNPGPNPGRIRGRIRAESGPTLADAGSRRAAARGSPRPSPPPCRAVRAGGHGPLA
jgi:hypothetical protein